MPRRPRVRINTSGVSQLLRSAGVRADLDARGQAVLDAAVASAPVDTGEHQASLHLEHDTTDRAVVRIVAGTDHSLVAETATGHMTRSLDAARR